MAKADKAGNTAKYPLNLPDTSFPMRGDLPKREPAWVADWEKRDLYHVIQNACKGRRNRFVIHDGPPYANGEIHLGHALNKILKDIINKTKLLEGYDVPYVPGWDCHGMPIEIQIEKMYGKGLEKSDLIAKARAYAKEQVEKQKTGFKRLGVLADWENPYLTMRPETEAAEIRTLAKIVEKGYVYRGLKPVNWCFDCCSALAEAEVEYADRESYAIDVAFKLSEEDKSKVEALFGVTFDKPCYTVIWTTTPWTIPANQAINMHPELTYALVDCGDRYLILGANLVEDCLKRYKMTGKVVAETNGKGFDHVRFMHPFSELHEGYKRFSPVFLAEYVDATSGTGIVHSAPAYGVDDFISCKANGITNDDILNPVMGNGVYADWLPLFAGMNIWKAQPKIVDTMRVANVLLNCEMIQHRDDPAEIHPLGADHRHGAGLAASGQVILADDTEPRHRAFQVLPQGDGDPAAHGSDGPAGGVSPGEEGQQICQLYPGIRPPYQVLGPFQVDAGPGREKEDGGADHRSQPFPRCLEQLLPVPGGQVGGRPEGHGLVEEPGGLLGVGPGQVAPGASHPGADPAGIGDRQHRRCVPAHLHHLVVGDALVLRIGGGGRRRKPGDAAQGPGGALGQVIRLHIHFSKKSVHLLTVRRAQRLHPTAEETVQVIPVSLGAGHPPGAGVGLLQQSQLGEGRHLVPEGGAGHRLSEIIRQQSAPNGFPSAAVQEDDGVQHPLFPIIHSHEEPTFLKIFSTLCS